MFGSSNRTYGQDFVKSVGAILIIAVACGAHLLYGETDDSARRLTRPLPVQGSGPGAWDRLDVSEYRQHARLRFDTLDGHRLKAYFYPAPAQKNADIDRLIMVPDVYSQDFQALEPIIANLNRKFHVVLMIPRGHIPSDRDWIGRRRLADDLARNPRTSSWFLNDYRSLLSLLDRTETLPGRKGRTCILAGKFHSTVLLLDEVAGVDCLVLLSPNPSFFQRDLATQVSDRVKVPILMINDERTGFRLRSVAERLPAARVSLFPMAGVGMDMLHRRPEIIDTIREFLEDPRSVSPANSNPVDG